MLVVSCACCVLTWVEKDQHIVEEMYLCYNCAFGQFQAARFVSVLGPFGPHPTEDLLM